MASKLKHFITIGKKKYFYTLQQASKHSTVVECQAAKIKQEFLNEDIPELLSDLPKLIIAEKNYKNQQSEVIRFRVSSKDKKLIEKRALQNGYPSVSGYLRDVSLGNS